MRACVRVPGDGAVVCVHHSLQVCELQEGLVEVMQVNDTHLWNRDREITCKHEGFVRTFRTFRRRDSTSRKAAGMKILVKRTGTENFSSPMSSNLQTENHHLLPVHLFTCYLFTCSPVTCSPTSRLVGDYLHH